MYANTCVLNRWPCNDIPSDIHPIHRYSLLHCQKCLNVLFQVEMKGLTNLIKFDNQGFRTDFLLDIIELSSAGIRKVGDWNSTQGVNFTRSYDEQQQEIVDNLKNKKLVISAILSDPYCMRKDSSEKLVGNNQFEGYAIDLIHEISKILGFNYTFRLVPDGRYGSLNKQTGSVFYFKFCQFSFSKPIDLANFSFSILIDQQ